jgi:eukaryotic-like serine/threonine-protein kinase
LIGEPNGYGSEVHDAHPHQDPATAGEVLAGRYELVRRIARGGMADVFEARDVLLDRPVAIKRFRAAGTTDRQRFDAEVRLLAGLNHPGLVAVYDAGEHDGDGFMVLELVPGPTLHDVLAEQGPRSADETARLGAVLAEALAHVHERGIVHRDLTPANILIARDGTPRLTDFGIARLIDTTRVTADHLTVGTAGYMAPEQVEGRDVTPAADVYSLGLVLLEALTGARAFTGPSHEAAIARLTRDPDIPAQLPEPWPSLLRSMTARRAADRPPAHAVASELAGVGRSEGHGGRAPTAAVVVPSGGASADPAAVTQPIPVSVGPSPGTPGSRPEPTSVMPVALRPRDDGPPEDQALARDERTATPQRRSATPTVAASIAAAATTASGAVERAGAATAGGARRLTPLQWLVLVGLLLVAVAATASGSRAWQEDRAALRAAAAAQVDGAPADTTTTTTAPTTTTTAAPAAPVIEDDDDEGESKGKGRGKGKGDEDDD